MRIARMSAKREHVDLFFHEHRDQFKIAYHEPPPNAYFRNYRLEVDWQEDLDMIRGLAKHASMLSPTKTIVATLDRHHEVARLNRERVERTGPSCYTYAEQRAWAEEMRGKPIVGWDGTVWLPPDERAEPVHCNSGQCLLGYAYNGTLYTRAGDQIRGDALMGCACGAKKRWNARA